MDTAFAFLMNPAILGFLVALECLLVLVWVIEKTETR